MKRGLTEIVFIIDNSMAMRGLEDDVIREFNFMLERQRDIEGEALATTMLFDGRYELFHDRTDIRAAALLTREEYTTEGKTALLDAIGRAMHKFRRIRYGTKEEFRAEKVIFVIITGSRENASRGYTEEMIRQRIEYRKKKYGWEFVFFGANMDAAAEAGKIGISAEWAQSFRTDQAGIREVYAAVSAMLAAFRKNTRISYGEDPVANSTSGNVAHYAAETTADDGIIGLIRRHWSKTAVLTDGWSFEDSGKELAQEELLEGEISAAIFQVGCYTVRSARRFYKIHAPGYSPELETPADRADVDLIRRDMEHEYAELCRRGGEPLEKEKWLNGRLGGRGLRIEPWQDRLRVVHEISARHNSDPDSSFTYICRAASSRSWTWREMISGICTAKENEYIPDEYASLLVCLDYIGDSFSVETWYKLEPTGKQTSLRLHPFDENMDKARFI